MKQYTLLTASGINKLLKTASDGSKIALKEIVVSDFEGELSEQITSIPNEKYRGAINAVTIDENDNNILDVDAIIPPEVGGFYIKTAGIYCDDGSLFAVARLADTYKPLLNEGSSKDITLNFKLQIANANESIVLKVDNNVVLATRKWSENQFLKKTDKIDAYTTQESDDKFVAKEDIATETKAGITKLKNAITAKQEDAAVTEKAVSDFVQSHTPPSLGVDQTWQDMTSNRNPDVTYTNTTGRAIFVNIVDNFSGNGRKYDFYVDGKNISPAGNQVGHTVCHMFAIIPPNSTYRATNLIMSITKWYELR